MVLWRHLLALTSRNPITDGKPLKACSKSLRRRCPHTTNTIVIGDKGKPERVPELSDIYKPLQSTTEYRRRRKPVKKPVLSRPDTNTRRTKLVLCMKRNRLSAHDAQSYRTTSKTCKITILAIPLSCAEGKRKVCLPDSPNNEGICVCNWNEKMRIKGTAIRTEVEDWGDILMHNHNHMHNHMYNHNE